ncbi:MAG: hypothetical protein NVS9B14_14980 [Candidatus Acidiferrum sp.]
MAPGPGGPGFHHMELLGIGGFHGGKVVTGAPFTATAVTTFSHTLADGNKISNTHQVSLFRDSQGRFRKEGSVPPVGELAVAQPHSFVVIQDPVASKGYFLNPDKKVVHIMAMNGRGHRGLKGPGVPGAESSASPDAMEANEAGNPNVTKEALGTQTINGVSAQGTRYTRTIPAGKIGNDKPLVVTREVWYSPDLQMVVQSKHSDPRFGDTTYSLTNIQRNEPPANLFIVPSDYTVKEGGPHGGPGMMHKHAPAPPADAPPAPTM